MSHGINYGWVYIGRWYCCRIISYKDGICTIGIGDDIVEDVPCDKVQPINGCKLPWE